MKSPPPNLVDAPFVRGDSGFSESEEQLDIPVDSVMVVTPENRGLGLSNEVMKPCVSLHDSEINFLRRVYRTRLQGMLKAI